MRKSSQYFRWGTILAAAFVVATLAFFAQSWWTPTDFLLRQWGSELTDLPDDQVPLRLEQIAALESRGIPTLVEALHSDREIVADGALLHLERQLGQWELLSTADSTPEVARLAAELAGRSAQPGPYSARGNRLLATRILLWPVHRERANGEQLVADCETVLRAALPRKPIEGADDSQPNRHSETARSELPRVEVSSALPGGNLPVQLVSAPALAPREATITSPTASEPQPFVSPEPPRLLDEHVTNQHLESNSPSYGEPTPADPRDRLQLRRQLPPPTTTVPSRARESLHDLSDLQVMRLLADEDPGVARDAVNELYRRGFQTPHIQIAKAMMDPDIGVRLRLVDGLPQQAGIDARPWLLWLSRDPAPAVRQAAIAVIATSREPALLDRLREMAREETDDQVLRVVRQVLRDDRLR